MKYAIVKIIEENPTPLAPFGQRYLEHRTASGCAKHSVQNEARVMKKLSEFMGAVSLSDVTPERADAWRLLLVGRYAANYTRLNLCAAKAMYEYAISLGIVSDNPFARIQLPKMTFAGRILSVKDLRTFIRALPDKARRMAKFALYTGMRRGEVVDLDWSEISNNTLTIPAYRAKSRKERTIYLSRKALNCLGPRGTGRVFSLNRGNLNAAITKTWRSLGLGRIRFHDLRHIAATRHYERNRDDQSLMKSFGWSSPSSAQPYHHVSENRERVAMSRVTYAI